MEKVVIEDSDLPTAYVLQSLDNPVLYKQHKQTNTHACTRTHTQRCTHFSHRSLNIHPNTYTTSIPITSPPSPRQHDHVIAFRSWTTSTPTASTATLDSCCQKSSSPHPTSTYSTQASVPLPYAPPPRGISVQALGCERPHSSNVER